MGFKRISKLFAQKPQLNYLSEESTNSGPVEHSWKGPLLCIKDIAKHSYESSTYIQVDQLGTQTSTGMKDIGNESTHIGLLHAIEINQYVIRGRCPSNEKYFEAFSYQLGLDTIFVTYQRFVRVIYFSIWKILQSIFMWFGALLSFKCRTLVGDLITLVWSRAWSVEGCYWFQGSLAPNMSHNFSTW